MPDHSAPVASFAALQDGSVPHDAPNNFDVVLDVPVTVALEIGRARIAIRKLLQLGHGSVIALERATAEPLDVVVNGTIVAHGDVVVVNDRLAVRLTDVVSPGERIRRLPQ